MKIGNGFGKYFEAGSVVATRLVYCIGLVGVGEGQEITVILDGLNRPEAVIVVVQVTVIIPP